jgi:hypothetical protein
MSITNRSRRHDEHVDGSDAECMVAKEAAPRRRRWVRPAQHVFRDSRLTDLDTELEQLTVDPWRAPERVSEAHLTDQFASCASYRPSSRPRTPTPVEPKALAVPLDHGGGLHQHQHFEATGPHSLEPHPHQPIDVAQPQTARSLTIEDRHLMTQRDQLEFQFGAATNPTSQPREHGRYEGEHAGDTTGRQTKSLEVSYVFGIFGRDRSDCKRNRPN